MFAKPIVLSQGHSFHDIQGLTRNFDVKSLMRIFIEFHFKILISNGRLYISLKARAHYKIRDFLLRGNKVDIFSIGHFIFRVTQPSILRVARFQNIMCIQV